MRLDATINLEDGAEVRPADLLSYTNDTDH